MLIRKFKISIFVFLTLMSVSCHDERPNCDCESNFAWVKKTFEENDAGFQYVLDKKGKEAYNLHNKAIEERIKSAKEVSACRDIMADWLTFFRKDNQHLQISIFPGTVIKETFSPVSVLQMSPDWETIEVDTVEFKDYLQQKKDIDFEGIWDLGKYKCGIKKEGDNYIGFIIDYRSDIIDYQTDKWEKGQVKFKIFPDNAIYYKDKSTPKNERFIMFGKNIIYMKNANINIARLFPKYEDIYSQSMIDYMPYCTKINENTVYLRIPSFYSHLQNAIESVVSVNKKPITTTENLIIDLRFNGGGSDQCWLSIMPFIISVDSVRLKPVYRLSTKLNNQQAKEWGLNESFMKELDSNSGKFVLQSNDEKYTIVNLGNVFPQKVAILVNEMCASSTEAFLLLAQQSQKVKIFGTTTTGALDFVNVNTVRSPCNQYLLTYATSKSVDVDDNPFDGVGIQPDYYIGKDIPDYKWVDYVNKILKKGSHDL
jgi:hypothetical protein